MALKIDPKLLEIAISGARWSAVTRTGLDAGSFANWDPKMLRKPRLLVPVDVQALYVPKGHTEEFLRVPLALTTPDGDPPEKSPAPFSKTSQRESGVHLHWANPDAMMQGEMSEAQGGVKWGSSLANRWLVLRNIAPKGAGKTSVRGWIIESDTSRVFDLANWYEGIEGPAAAQPLQPEELNAGAGGSVNWTASYDASINRFALYDPLDDLEDQIPNGAYGDLASYFVAGWWSDQSLDPLDNATTAMGLQERLNTLKWSAAIDDGKQVAYSQETDATSTARTALGLKEQTRLNLVEIDDLSDISEHLSEVGVAEIFQPNGTRFVATKPKVIYSTLLSGHIYGVPILGAVVADQRPNADRVEVAVGTHTEDLVASFTTSNMGFSDTAQRRQAERILNALASDTMSRVGEPNGAAEIEEMEHAAAFTGSPGDDGLTERILDRGGPETLSAGRHARSRNTVKPSKSRQDALQADVTWSGSKRGKTTSSGSQDRAAARMWEKARKPARSTEAAARLVTRPGPRYFQPIEPLIGVRNIKRAIRQRYNFKASATKTLQCRWPSQVATKQSDIIDGAKLLGTFPRGNVPTEVLRLAQSAVAFDPYIGPWVAAAAAADTGIDQKFIAARVNGEAALRFSKDGVFDGTVPGFRSGKATRVNARETRIGDQIRRFSMADGIDPDPVAVTSWSQPWLPLWLEWEAEIDVTTSLNGWSLGTVDFDATATLEDLERRKLSGRSPVDTGAAQTMIDTFRTWIELENARDMEAKGEASEPVQKQLGDLIDHLSKVDILSATCNGFLNSLLGVPTAVDGQTNQKISGALQKLVPNALPKLLYSGQFRLNRARIIDAFGRVMDLRTNDVQYPARDRTRRADAMRLRPRLSRPTRWNFRFTDPADGSETPKRASIDQARPELVINPISGYLLPDLIDEALEVFDTQGNAVGQIMHEPVSGGVMWEIAPGRSGPADSGPLFDLAPAHLPLGRIAAAMVESDAKFRNGLPTDGNNESALSAFLRAVDTTLWSIDTFASLGTPYIAGLVGRPMAVVRATLRLQINDDLDSLDLSDPQILADRQTTYDELQDRSFPVRIGELTRDDDGLYGFFVNDDFSRFHLVDKLVKDAAFISGQRRGHFAQLGRNTGVPATQPITHPFIVAEDQLELHLGQTVRLTMLMHPAGKVHVTSGLLPRKSLQLMRDWTEIGLSKIAPSARIGPVLIDTDKVRLPRVASFGKDQTWTRRDTPFTWRDDPILAATQSAILPDSPAQIEEGYIRISPVTNEEGTS